MAITKQQKTEIVGAVSQILKDAKTVVFVKFNRLNVAATTLLRKKLRGEKVGYTVAKKTLLKRALSEENITGELPLLEGEIAIAYSTDELAPAREIYNFSRDYKDNVKIVGGIFEGKYMDANEMLSIATIPGMQVLRGQFVNLINSPLQGLVIALNAIAEKKQ